MAPQALKTEFDNTIIILIIITIIILIIIETSKELRFCADFKYIKFVKFNITRQKL